MLRRGAGGSFVRNPPLRPAIGETTGEAVLAAKRPRRFPPGLEDTSGHCFAKNQQILDPENAVFLPAIFTELRFGWEAFFSETFENPKKGFRPGGRDGETC